MLFNMPGTIYYIYLSSSLIYNTVYCIFNNRLIKCSFAILVSPGHRFLVTLLSSSVFSTSSASSSHLQSQAVQLSHTAAVPVSSCPYNCHSLCQTVCTTLQDCLSVRLSVHLSNVVSVSACLYKCPSLSVQLSHAIPMSVSHLSILAITASSRGFS